MSNIKISELVSTTSVTGSAFIPVDDGSTTKKITVDDYNRSSNTTAMGYAQQAADSAASATSAAAQINLRLNDVDSRLATTEILVHNASDSASFAAESMAGANIAAENAAQSSSNAYSYALDAEESASDVDAIAMMSKSFAVGGTGTRSGEDTDNAKYYAQVASSAISGGVIMFNERSGIVVPEDGDYSSDMVSHGDSTVAMAIEGLVDDLDDFRSATIENLNTKVNKNYAKMTGLAEIDGQGLLLYDRTNRKCKLQVGEPYYESAPAVGGDPITHGATGTIELWRHDRSIFAYGSVEITTDANTEGNKINIPGSSGTLVLDGIALKTLTVAGWTLNGSVYQQTIGFDEIYTKKPIITACGATLGADATAAQRAALSRLNAIGDSASKTITFTAPNAPTVEINLSIWGVK